MNAKFQTALTKIGAVALMADGTADEAEYKVLENICSDLGAEWASFKLAVEKEAKIIAGLDEDATDSYIEKACKDVDATEANILFEAAMHIVLADKVLTLDECGTLYTIADMLGVDPAVVLARVAFSVQEDGIQVDVEDSLEEL